MRTSYHHGHLAEAALDSAGEILADVGLERLSLRAVAARAGVSHGALYRHFTSKEQLLTATVDRAFADIEERLGRIRARETPDVVARMARCLLRWCVENPGLFEALAARTGAHGAPEPTALPALIRTGRVPAGAPLDCQCGSCRALRALRETLATRGHAAHRYRPSTGQVHR